MDEKEFEEFKETLYLKLPVTFRVNPSHQKYESLVEILRDPEFV